MFKKIIAFACAVVISAASFSTLAFADGGKLTQKGGSIYCVDGGKYLTGWQDINGERYYFRKTGEAVTKSATIGGIRYKFSSDGVCQGKYTGWAKSNGKRFYYLDGVKAKGWFWSAAVNKPNEWFYFDETSGALATSTTVIDGKEYEFSSDGVWKGKNSIDSGSCYNRLMKKLSKDDHGGIYINNSALVVMSVNEKNIRKVTDKMKDQFAQIVIKDCKFSANELEKVSSFIWKNRKKFGVAGISTDIKNNWVEVEMPKDNSKFSEYLKSLDDSSIVHITYCDITAIDD